MAAVTGTVNIINTDAFIQLSAITSFLYNNVSEDVQAEVTKQLIDAGLRIEGITMIQLLNEIEPTPDGWRQFEVRKRKN